MITLQQLESAFQANNKPFVYTKLIKFYQTLDKVESILQQYKSKPVRITQEVKDFLKQNAAIKKSHAFLQKQYAANIAAYLDEISKIKEEYTQQAMDVLLNDTTNRNHTSLYDRDMYVFSSISLSDTSANPIYTFDPDQLKKTIKQLTSEDVIISPDHQKLYSDCLEHIESHFKFLYPILADIYVIIIRYMMFCYVTALMSETQLEHYPGLEYASVTRLSSRTIKDNAVQCNREFLHFIMDMNEEYMNSAQRQKLQQEIDELLRQLQLAKDGYKSRYDSLKEEFKEYQSNPAYDDYFGPNTSWTGLYNEAQTKYIPATISQAVISEVKTKTAIFIKATDDLQMEAREDIKGAVRVFVRVRNFQGSSVFNREYDEISCNNQHVPFTRTGVAEIIKPSNSTGLNDLAAEQQTVYNNIFKDIMELSLKGRSVVLFGYGYSGSGKTYTLLGKPDGLSRVCFSCSLKTCPKTQPFPSMKLLSYIKTKNSVINPKKPTFMMNLYHTIQTALVI